ncbi:MAG: DUF2793 domain-containing protein [Gemmobacter sp.]|nr:DUF2793 domain-containing protein [Gemmobacter sp.]
MAFRIDGAWLRLVPRPGWKAWVEAEALPLIRTASTWLALDAAMGLITRSASVTVARGAHDSTVEMAVFEDTLSDLSDSDTSSSIVIPAGTILLGVSTRTLTAITGATSFDCGIAGNPGKFGASLGIAPGSTHPGLIAPEPVPADTAVLLTANGGPFTGGAVRIAIHTLTRGIPA